MKKTVLAAFMVLFASAAWAEVKFDLSGDFMARGTYWKNFGQVTDASVGSSSYSTYDGDINLYPRIIIDKKTSLNFKIAIRDETWGDLSNQSDSNSNPDTNSVYNDYTDEKDDNINIERAFIESKPKPNMLLRAGLCDGGIWATSFADYKMGRYRVAFEHYLQDFWWGAIFEKGAELGNSEVDDSEDDDFDAYGLWATFKVGTVNVKPLFWLHHDSSWEGEYAMNAYTVYDTNWTTYATTSATYDDSTIIMSMRDDGSNALDIWIFNLGFDGTLGPIEFESEFDYWHESVKGEYVAGNNYHYQTYYTTGGFTFPVDYTIPEGTILSTFENHKYAVWGAYVNLWKTFDSCKPGLTMAYGSWDENGGYLNAGSGFDFKDDFKSNLILGDWIAWGGNASSSTGDLVGMTLIKPYVANIATPIKKLTAAASFGYISSNQKDTIYEDAKAWEVDLGASYRITDNLKYTVQAGYADLNYDVIDDPDPIMLLCHRLDLSF